MKKTREFFPAAPGFRRWIILIMCIWAGLITCAGQNCPDDFWRKATLITDKPIEVQAGKGQAIIPLLFERKDTTIVETWIITKKITTPPPPPTPLKIEAEQALSITNAAAVGTVLAHVTPGAVVIYGAIAPTDRYTKVRFRYARGYTGTGVWTFRVGTTNYTFNFPSTGGWGNFVEIEFAFSGTGEIRLLSNEIGPCNIDYFTLL